MSSEGVEAAPFLLAAAFVAGALNAVAGGGSFVSFPALVFVGMPPVAANATSTVALLPGYVSGAFGFREDVRAVNNLGVPWLLAISLIGGGIGALLLLATPDTVFRAIVPWLLFAATRLFALSDRLAARRENPKATGGATTGSVPMGTALLVVSVYGGYFNSALGILLLALFSLFGETNLNTMNGLKNLISAALTTIAVVAYAAAGAVQWPEAPVMMVAAGGYAGARIARRVRPRVLRLGIVAIGFAMGIGFLVT